MRSRKIVAGLPVTRVFSRKRQTLITLRYRITVTLRDIITVNNSARDKWQKYRRFQRRILDPHPHIDCRKRIINIFSSLPTVEAKSEGRKESYSPFSRGIQEKPNRSNWTHCTGLDYTRRINAASPKEKKPLRFANLIAPGQPWTIPLLIPITSSLLFPATTFASQRETFRNFTERES